MSKKTPILERGGLTLTYHDNLNPLLFTGDHLNPDIRSHLLAIAEEFVKFLKIPLALVKDVLGTGGNFNFNYTSFSDIDVHVVVDKAKLGVDPAWMEDYLQTKKAYWIAKHHITVKGYNVELYPQGLDDNPAPVNSGIYSLQDDKWLQEPVNDHINFGSNDEIEREADNYEDVILNMIKNDASIDEFNKLKEHFRTMRLNAVHNGGEFSTGNLIFKEVRNRGLFDKINDFILNKFDRNLSVSESKHPKEKQPLTSFQNFIRK